MVISVTRKMLLSPALCWSATSGAPPVTNAFNPCGAGVESTISRTAATDSLARGSPWLPCRYTCT